MKKRVSLPLTFLALIMLLSVLELPASADASTMPGFTAQKAGQQLLYEDALKAIPDPVVARELSVALTSHSTLVGSEEDWQNVGISVNWLQNKGLDP